ncbi:unnamed protein product, partial [Brassica oleracea var. botrytis]
KKNKKKRVYQKNITKNNMSSSQFAIFCIILIALFPLHEFVDGQIIERPFMPPEKTCTEIQCPTKRDKARRCFCCGVNEERI